MLHFAAPIPEVVLLCRIAESDVGLSLFHLLNGAVLRPGGFTSPEFVAENLHRRNAVIASQNPAIQHKAQGNMVVEQHRPVHPDRNMLAGPQIFVGFKEQAAAADIQRGPMQRTTAERGTKRPVTDTQLQRKAKIGAAFRAFFMNSGFHLHDSPFHMIAARLGLGGRLRILRRLYHTRISSSRESWKKYQFLSLCVGVRLFISREASYQPASSPWWNSRGTARAGFGPRARREKEVDAGHLRRRATKLSG